jgi:histone H3/H4
VKRTASFVAYSGETTDELLGYPAQEQCDLLVRAFEEGLQRKISRSGERGLSKEERTVLAVRALDREVNNGGYDQFFRNSSKKFAAEIVQSLTRIGCRRTAKITQRAITALHSGRVTVSRIEAAMRQPKEERDRELERCDQSFYRAPQGISRRLYAFIKANSIRIRL